MGAVRKISKREGFEGSPSAKLQTQSKYQASITKKPQAFSLGEISKQVTSPRHPMKFETRLELENWSFSGLGALVPWCFRSLKTASPLSRCRHLATPVTRMPLGQSLPWLGPPHRLAAFDFCLASCFISMLRRLRLWINSRHFRVLPIGPGVSNSSLAVGQIFFRGNACSLVRRGLVFQNPR